MAKGREGNMEKICPFMSKPKLYRFEGHTPDTDGTYDEFVYCQKEECIAWCKASEPTQKREKYSDDIIYRDISYCKLIERG